MAEHPRPNPDVRKGNLVSAASLTAERLVKGIFHTAPDDDKRIAESLPGIKAKGKS